MGKSDLGEFGTAKAPCRGVFIVAMKAEPGIPAERVAAFMRQLTHDVRNGLNGLDLETALLEEVVADGEGQDCVERLRRQLRVLAGQMRALSVSFQDPEPIAAPIAARELFLIWREQHASLADAPEVRWVDELGDEMVSVDAGLMAAVLTELLTNAAAFSPAGVATATARREGNEVAFELREPKAAALNPAEWGQAFLTTRRGGYGLGLWAARRSVVANHAAFAQRYEPDEGALITRISMPLV